MKFDVEKIRKDFPILDQEINGSPLVYLDNGATTQKPNSVIDAISNYYRGYNANVHRGAHTLSDRATEAFENARTNVASFIKSPSSNQVIWTRGTTEAINLVAATWGNEHLEPHDLILVSELEHHSNIVPWQMIAERKGALVKVIPISDEGEINIPALEKLLFDNRVKLVAINHVSNALGTINPIEDIISMSHNAGAKVLVDGAQAISHWQVDVQALDCDFYVFSGHKMFGPTGIGVLWGKLDLLESMAPYQGGGEMIETCSFEGTTYNQLPYKFEAGTPDIAGAIGLSAAVDYLNLLDRKAAHAHELNLLDYIGEKSKDVSGLISVGTAKNKTSIFSFLIEGSHPSDLGMLLDQQGIAVRTGHHCAQPLMSRLNIPGTVRASVSFYNNLNDIDLLFSGIEKAKQFLL